MSASGRRPATIWLALSFGGAVAAASLLWVLAALPYSTSLITDVPIDEAGRRSSSEMRLGPVTVDLGQLANSPSLEPFRREFAERCGGRSGIAAALCLSDSMARAFPHGGPRTEFVLPEFEPVVHLKEHMQGAPGYCLTRSTILVSCLLSAGIPSRVIQLVPERRNGHTVAEVWDGGSGWVLIDPSYGTVLEVRGRPAAAAALLRDPTGARWAQKGISVLPDQAVPWLWSAAETRSLHLFYPEPWLYLRAGRRSASWPYRARFLHVGRPDLRLGLGQRLLPWAIAACLASTLVGLIRALTRPSHTRERGYGSTVERTAPPVLDAE